jgi:hypothetical protein
MTNNSDNTIINYQMLLSISKNLYNKTTSFLYSIDYFNLYNKYKNYNKIKIAEIELDLYKLNNYENTNEIIVCDDVEDNKINKLRIVKNKATYINNTLKH